MSDVRIIVDDSRIEAKVDALQADVDQLLKALVKPRIVFTFGPFSEQKELDAHGRSEAGTN
jgi:hypothetical protein